MQRLDIETGYEMYCSQVRIPKEEGIFTLVEGGKYLMPPEERWTKEPAYVMAVVIGTAANGPNGEEVFIPKEDVTLKVTRSILRGRSVMVDDEFYQEWHSEFQEVPEDEEGDDIEVVEFWLAERVS